MTTRHKRNIRYRLAEFWNDCGHKWDYHGKAFMCGVWSGFLFGAFIVLMAFYFVVGLTW